MNDRQRVFVEEYLKCWNSSEAARRAGYNGRSNQIGSRLLTDVDIQAAIQARLAEIKMSADEVLKRLSDMARADIADFVDVSRPGDLANEKYSGKTHVIKKLKRKVTRDSFGREFEEMELEFYDAQAALEKIGKVHGLFNDKLEVSGPNGQPIEIREIQVHEPVES